MKNPLSPIPRPATERWRDFRLRFVPVLVYGTAIFMVAYLWNTQWMPSTFTGEVQARLATVASPIDGRLTDFTVRQFDRVTRGQVLGRVSMPPEVQQAALASMRMAAT